MLAWKLWFALFLTLLHPIQSFSPAIRPLLRRNLSCLDAEKADTDALEVAGVVAPLDYKGLYPCLALKFPNLKGTPVWNFVVDTGANMNTLELSLVQKYDLKRIKGLRKPTTTAGMGGEMSPGDLVMIGDAALAGLPDGQQNVKFVRNLTAAPLPRASPTDGILGSSFCSMFPGGVEFDWHGTDGDPPTFCFYSSAAPSRAAAPTQGMKCVPMKQMFGLFTVKISVNGKELVALLDTGSPITILDEEAAQESGVVTSGTQSADDIGSISKSEEQVSFQVGGIDGKHMEVARSIAKVDVMAGKASLGNGSIYVGTIPALSVMKNVAGDEDETPAAILGLDFLRRAYRMILLANPCELWVEELDGTRPKYKPLKTDGG